MKLDQIAAQLFLYNYLYTTALITKPLPNRKIIAIRINHETAEDDDDTSGCDPPAPQRRRE